MPFPVEFASSGEGARTYVLCFPFAALRGDAPLGRPPLLGRTVRFAIPVREVLEVA
jgi:hypothetical protein